MTEGTAPLTARQRGRAALPFIIVTLIWGSTWLVIRDQLSVVPPLWSVSYRFLLAGGVMLGVAAARGTSVRMKPADFGFAAGLGLTQFVLNYNFVYPAEHYVTSGLVALVFALLVVPNALLSWVFLKQGVSRAFLIGSGVAMIGVALLFAHEMETAAAGPRAVATGIALTLAAVLAASIANVMQASKRARALPVMVTMGWAMLIGATIDALLAWASSGPPVFEWRIGYVAGLFYLGIFGSAIAFALYFELIKEMGAARAAYSSVLIPVIAMGLSTLFEGYRWSVEAAVGGALALVGLAIALRARSPAR